MKKKVAHSVIDDRGIVAFQARTDVILPGRDTVDAALGLSQHTQHIGMHAFLRAQFIGRVASLKVWASSPKILSCFERDDSEMGLVLLNVRRNGARHRCILLLIGRSSRVLAAREVGVGDGPIMT
jgi:hypothetical protein